MGEVRVDLALDSRDDLLRAGISLGNVGEPGGEGATLLVHPQGELGDGNGAVVVLVLRRMNRRETIGAKATNAEGRLENGHDGGEDGALGDLPEEVARVGLGQGEGDGEVAVEAVAEDVPEGEGEGCT